MKHKDIIVLLVSAFFLVIAWVIFNIYHNSVVSTIPEVVQQQIVPIVPAFDQNSINKLKERNRISPIYDIKNESQTASEGGEKSL